MSSSSWIICRNSTGRERSEGSLVSVSVVMFSFLTASTGWGHVSTTEITRLMSLGTRCED